MAQRDTDTEGLPMMIDENRLFELCQQAAREKNSKKRHALTQRIDRLLAAACEAWERLKPSNEITDHRNDDGLPAS